MTGIRSFTASVRTLARSVSGRLLLDRSADPNADAENELELPLADQKTHRVNVEKSSVKQLYPRDSTWGRLELRGKIGEGAFSEIYHAWDPVLERDIALKLMLPDANQPEEAVFEEARRLVKIDDPNIARVYTISKHNGRVGLELEFVRGRTLDGVLAEQGLFSASEAVLIGLEVTRALGAVHRANVLHRDIKAANVMRDRNGRVVLVDFGLGQDLLAGSTGEAELCGTPLYLAPEIFEGAPASVRSDIYSVGVLLYHLLTGSFPVMGSTLEEISQNHKDKNVRLLRDARSGLPWHLSRTVDQALARNPDDRFATAGQMEMALLQVLDGASIASGSATRAHPPLRRSAVIGLAALSIAVLSGLTYYSGYLLDSRRASPVSIAVMPFANLSEDQGNEYFVDGVTEELIDVLSRLSNVRVAAPPSVFRFKAKAYDIADVGKRLHVQTIVEGSVRKHDDDLGIIVRVIDVASGSLLWSQKYSGKVKDVFTIQGEIATRMASTFQVQLAQSASIGIPSQNRDVEAYNLYLRGRYHWNKRTSESVKTGLAYFEKAVQRDKGFAKAYSGIADSYTVLQSLGAMPANIAMPKARDAAMRALAIDNTLPEAHTSLGFVRSAYEWQWDAADDEFRRATQLNPSFGPAYHWHAESLCYRGLCDEALREIQKALDVDPMSMPFNSAKAAYLYYSRRYPEAIQQLNSTLELNPEHMPAHFYLARSYARSGNPEEAIRQAKKAAELNGEGSLSLMLMSEIYALAGRQDEARAILRKLEEESAHLPGVPSSYLALVYSTLDEKDRAFEWLYRALAERDSSILVLMVNPAYDGLRQDSRYAALLDQLRLPAAAPSRDSPRTVRTQQ